MTQQRIIKLEESLRIVNRLINQLEENKNSFKMAVNGSIEEIYRHETDQALDHCKCMREMINQLLTEEQVRLQTGM